MKSVAIVDTLYPEFLKTVKYPSDYDAALKHVLDLSFGTSDFLSRAFHAFDWKATDIIANCEELTRLWNVQHHANLDHRAVILRQIREAEAHVIFAQDLEYFSLVELELLKKDHVLIGQCSCALGDLDKLKCFDLIFSSFPFYVEMFSKIGVEAVYLPLAFDPIVLSRIGRCQVSMGLRKGTFQEVKARERNEDYSCSFVGGFGWQWTNTESVLCRVAESIPGVRFCGYGRIPETIAGKHYGQAWGVDMYRILSRSKIVINRHGAIARDYSNNLRLFEATGCGALVLTEKSRNLRDFFEEDEIVSYDSASDAVDKMRYFLAHDVERRDIAQNGEERTLNEHTYLKRMATIDYELRRLLSPIEPYASNKSV